MQQGEVVEAGVTPRGPGGGLFDQHEQVLGPGTQDESPVCARVVAQADRAAVELGGALQVGHGQVDRAETQRGGQSRCGDLTHGK